MELLTIGEAAQLIGVSIGTLRSWDTDGVLKATRHRGTGHRRYYKDQILEFLQTRDGKPGKLSISSYAEGLYNLRSKVIDRCLEEFGEERYGGFSPECVAVMKRNEEDFNLTPLGESPTLKEICKLFVTPHLLPTLPMVHPMSSVTYMRHRYYGDETKTVFEMEEVQASVIEADEIPLSWGEPDPLDEFRLMARKFDSRIFEDIRNNAGTMMSCSAADLEETIGAMSDAMDERLQVSPRKWILYPPELRHASEFRSFAPDIRVDQRENIEDTHRRYIGRWTLPNTVLVGCDPEASYAGFVICPYLLRWKDGSRNKMLIGRKLLREGAHFYGKIVVT